MLGDFRYYSSSESSDDSDSDNSAKSDDHLDKLIAEKKILEEKIKEREMKLKLIHNTLKSLNDERKKLYAKRRKLVTTNEFVDADSSSEICEMSLSGQVPRRESDEQVLPSTSAQPSLNLNPRVGANDNEEEFDSDNEL